MNEWAGEHIPKASEEDGPPETGILTAQMMDWRCDGATGNEKARRNEKRKKEHV